MSITEAKSTKDEVSGNAERIKTASERLKNKRAASKALSDLHKKSGGAWRNNSTTTNDTTVEYDPTKTTAGGGGRRPDRSAPQPRDSGKSKSVADRVMGMFRRNK
jgi:hypothetical protein